MKNPINQFWILGRTKGALPAQLRFGIDLSLEGGCGLGILHWFRLPEASHDPK